MEGLRKKVDADIYDKLVAHRVNEEILWDLNEQDLKDMDINEKGPIKIILKYIAKKDCLEEDTGHSSTQGQPEVTIRSILEKDGKFQKYMRRYLDYELVPDHNGLLLMNRILTTYFFEYQITKEFQYPSWKQKQELAKKIIQEFPHLESTRINDEAPAESFFFWRCGGQSSGCHTGIIETRVGNMRKDVLPENRLFRRKKNLQITAPEGLEDIAYSIAAVNPTPQNARSISEGMKQCFQLHEWILKTNKDDKLQQILRTFPHLLNYRGLLIQQVFDEINENRDHDRGLDGFLRIGIMLDKTNWSNVQDPLLKGLLRIFKSLTNRGIKRKGSQTPMHPDEEVAAPLIRWLKCDENKTVIEVLNEHAREEGSQPHIVCMAELFKHGHYYVVGQGFTIHCGDSTTQVVDVFFKLFDVLGVPIPALLRNVHSIIAYWVFKSIETPASQTVQLLIKRFEELDID
nr:uncharacterized protein LOC109621257 [Aedes albopictus]XP_029729694.1 uncharacterized protein LOC109431111 [Aedes albopictus]